MNQEIRTLRFKGAEFRAEEAEGVKKIRGYAIVYNSVGIPYRGSEWTEVIDPGALSDVDLSELRLLVGHDTGQVLARAGINLRAEKDQTGLYIEASMPDTTLANDSWKLVQAGIIDGMSFRFSADRWETDSEKKQDKIMHITDIPEVSIVTFPAYPAAAVIACEQATEQRENEEPPKENQDERKRAETLLEIYLNS